MDALLEKLNRSELLTESEVFLVCNSITEILINEPNIIFLKSPITIVGDIHGQFYDLKNIFEKFGSPKDKKYCFLGDLVDRGYNSVEVILFLFIYKILYPSNIFLIRGNHESEKVTKNYGFFKEVKKKYNSLTIYRAIIDVFKYFLVSAIVDGRYYLVHGGISSQHISVDFFQNIKRAEIEPEENPLVDLYWSDPHPNLGFNSNNRGTGHAYGPDVTQLFLMTNDLRMIIRSHQIVMEGFKYNFKNKTVCTVWSAPNYCYRCRNMASILEIENGENNPKYFTHVEDQAPGVNLFVNPLQSDPAVNFNRKKK